MDEMEAIASNSNRAVLVEDLPIPHRPTVPADEVQSSERISGDSDELAQRLRSGHPVEAIVEFTVRGIDIQAFERAFDEGRKTLSEADLAFKRQAYASVKERGLSGLSGVEVIRDFENLPSSHIRLATESALAEILGRPDVRAVFAIKVLQTALNKSLPLIQQPAAAVAGHTGSGATVAVIDTGVDFTVAPFGCTAPGVPSGCRIKATFEAALPDGQRDSTGHGTIVSEIVHQTAIGANLVVVDAHQDSGFRGFYTADILEGITWVIANGPSMNIVSINLSMSDYSLWLSTCGSKDLATNFAAARAAGIQPVVSTGNYAFSFGAFSDGIGWPACLPAAVSVGAVFDDDLGNFPYADGSQFQCIEPAATEDSVACFSQTAPILSLLAPGAEISAGGITGSGTSFAAPHVAGAWAVVKAAAPPGATHILRALQNSGTPVTDLRIPGGRTTSRINLLPEPDLGNLAAMGALALMGMTRRRRKTA